MADKKKKEHPLWSSAHHSFSKFAVIATVFVLVILLVYRNGIITWIRAGFERRAQERQIERLQQEIRSMDREIDLLTHDKDSLETFARERFHFAAPGEDVYVEE